LEADFNMLYELVLGLARSSHSPFSLPNIYVGFFKAVIKDEEIVQQVHEDMANENLVVDLTL
jgi:hypothetical protein